jgi:anti-anti-sigma factor
MATYSAFRSAATTCSRALIYNGLHSVAREAAAPALRRQVRRHLRAGRRVINVDVGAVTFIDSLALGALAAATDRCACAHGSLTLTHVPARMWRVIQIAGLENVLMIDTAPAETPGA